MYRIPIQAPPGVAGVEPKLELVYNSQGANSFLGHGWGLGGLSTISRCRRTVGSDGVSGIVDLTNTDRFCLDGQRLLLTSGSPYGATTTQYRTERETFAQVTASGGDNGTSASYSGPTSFSVRTKAGLTLEFGGTADSRIEAPGKPAIVTWALNKVTDTKGNYMTVTYAEDTANGTFYPSRIDYTGNTPAAKAPGYSIQFTYQARTDQSAIYVAGVAVKLVQRLSSIKTYAGAAMVKDYRLAYVQPAGLPVSMLSSVTECVDASNCLVPVTFEHTPVTNALAVSSISTSASSIGLWEQGNWKDINGDGRADYCGVMGAAPSVLCVRSNGAGFDAATTFTAGGYYGSSTWAGKAGPDINGDGIVDYCGIATTESGGPESGVTTYSLNCFLANAAGAATTAVPAMAAANPLQFRHESWVDVNGDGRDDRCVLVLNQVPSGPETEVVSWVPTCTLSTGTAWGASWVASAMDSNSSFATRWLDINRDGYADLCYVYGASSICLLSTGSGFGGTWTGPSFPYGTSGAQDWVDVNGDGTIDSCRMQPSTQNLHCVFNTGVGFSGSLTSGAITVYDPAGSWVDVNGDGKADFCRAVGTDKLGCTLSTGSGFGETVVSPSLPIFFTTAAGKWVDVNGDGFLDYCDVNVGSMVCYLSRFMDARIDRIVDSAGASIAITYQSLAVNSGVYTRDSTATFPVKDRQFAAYVVSSVAKSTGIGTTLTTNYTYGGLKEDSGVGRGMLGFRWVKSQNLATLVETTTNYRQDWPYVGMPSSVEERLPGSGSGGLLKRSTRTYGCKIPLTAAACAVANGNRYFPHETQRVDEAWDLNGSTNPTVTTATTHNINAPDTELRGDPTQVVVTRSLGGSNSTQTTQYEYWAPSVTGGVTGRVKRSTVTTLVP